MSEALKPADTGLGLSNFDIGLAVGTHAWFGDISDKGTGASFTGNTTGSLAIRTTNAFAVDGMLDTTVRDNTLRALPMEKTAGCIPQEQ